MIPTPTCNASLPLRLGGFATLREALDHAALGDTGLNFHDSRGRLHEVVAYRQLRARALTLAAGLHALGLPAGSRVAMAAETTPTFLALFHACQYAGLVPCPLPSRQLLADPAGHALRLQRLLAQAAPALVVVATLGEADPLVPIAQARGLALTDAQRLSATPAPAQPLPAGGSAIAYVQFSSGSTAEPKGVVVTQAALMANATAIARHGLRMRADDRACSWLPLYHDMGLVGFSVVALCAQRSVDYLAPATFAARPALWLQLMSASRSTISYAPLFAWQLAARRLPAEAGIDLSALRVAGVGGDLVRAEPLADCMAQLAARGLRAEAWQPSYGLAEATLAVSMGEVAAAPRSERVALLETGQTVVATAVAADAAARRVVSAGPPLPGTELEIRGPAGELLADGEVGQVCIRGPGVMQHYLGQPDGRDDRGFLATGDLGYLRAGEVFITGRSKDMLALHGRNLWLRDIEWTAERAAPGCAGEVAALAIEEGGEPRLVLLVQRRPAIAEAAALAAQLQAAVLHAVGASVQVVFTAPRSFPYTTSGKLARGLLRERYLQGQLDVLDLSPSLPPAPTCAMETP